MGAPTYISSKNTLEIIEFNKNDCLEVFFRVYPNDDGLSDDNFRQAIIVPQDIQEWAEREGKINQSRWETFEDDSYPQSENFIEYFEAEFEQNEIEEFLFDYFSMNSLPIISTHR